MLFAYLFYKMTKEGLVSDDGMGFLGIAAFLELSAEIGLLTTLVSKLL